MQDERQLYGQVLIGEHGLRFFANEWAAMDESERREYTRDYPATVVSGGVDPSPYLEGSGVDLGEVMEYIMRDLAQRNVFEYPVAAWHPSESK